MDLLSHAALGRTLIALAPDDRKGRAVVVAGTLGALSPDIDAVLMPFGWDVYLRAHEIGTHTIVGTMVCAVLTASLVRLFARTQQWRLLAFAAWVGATSHVSLDVLSSARIRVLWPMVDRQFSIPLVAMADPWLAAILIGGALAFLAAGQKKTVAVVVIGTAAAFLSLKAVMAPRALNDYRAVAGGGNSTSRIVEAKWASLSQWHVYDRTPDHLRLWRTTAGSQGAELILSWPAGVEHPLVKESRSLSAVQNFLHVHDLTLATTVAQPDGREWVLWSDIRFCWNPDARDAPQLEPIVGTGGARLSCALWFGGEFDGGGNPVRQIVKVAGFTQTRAVGE
jgi:membrane-bound metal-dependent hydrolase YbcI (DUF457 family)